MNRADALYQFMFSLAVAVLICLLLYVAVEVQDIQAQLDHIDTHFQAPEPTPQQNGVTG